MFRLISFVFTIIISYFLYHSLYAFNDAFINNLGIEAIVYHGVYVLFYGVGIVGNYVAMFSGTEIYVTTQNQE